VINGILKCVERRVDLFRIQIDKAQSIWWKTKFAAAGELDQPWKFSREMIGYADDLDLLID
jgi:hypothetical protein